MTDRMTCLLAGSLLVLLSSCNTTSYISSTNIQPVTQAPYLQSEKGDIQLYGDYSTFQSAPTYSWRRQEDAIYSYLPKRAGTFSLQGSAEDELSLGIYYKYDRDNKADNHGITFMVASFEKKDLRLAGYTGAGANFGISVNTGKSIMSADSIFFNLWVTDLDGDGIPDPGEIFFDFTISPSGYYMIRHIDFKMFAQASYTYGNKFFEWDIGGSLGYHYRPRFNPGFEFDPEVPETLELSNPVVFYNRNKHFLFIEYFMAIGFGPEQFRIVATFGAGHRIVTSLNTRFGIDPIQPTYSFGQIGIRSIF